MLNPETYDVINCMHWEATRRLNGLPGGFGPEGRHTLLQRIARPGVPIRYPDFQHYPDEFAAANDLLLAHHVINAEVQNVLAEVAHFLPDADIDNLELNDMRQLITAILQQGGPLNQQMVNLVQMINHQQQHP